MAKLNQFAEGERFCIECGRRETALPLMEWVVCDVKVRGALHSRPLDLLPITTMITIMNVLRERLAAITADVAPLA
jgi:hypothetical protein